MANWINKLCPKIEIKEEKKNYIKKEIIDQGYDEEKFNTYIKNLNNENNNNISKMNCSMDNLKQIVTTFKNINSSSLSSTTEKKEKCPETLEVSIEGIIPGIQKSQYDKDVFKIFGEAFSKHEEKIYCEKLKENELSKREDLYIDIISPVKIKTGGLSFSYYQYTIKTEPIGFSVVRKLSDFELLNETIPKYNKGKFNPLLTKFPMNLSDDSEKKLIFLKYYLNSIIEEPYYRSLPIVLNFLSLSQNEWDIKAKQFQKVKEITSIEKMLDLNGFYDIKISDEENFKATKIKEDLKKKEAAYKKLNEDIDELFPYMEKMSVCLKNISQDLLQLKYIYGDGNKSMETLSDTFHHLYLIIKSWGEDYIKQTNFLKNEFKYFFKYMSKEINSFNDNYERYENIKEEYKNKFAKYQKKSSLKSKHHEEIKEYKKIFGFYLLNVKNEYNKLNERQGKRINKQFFLFNKEREVFFQDYENFLKLFNCKEKEFNIFPPDVSVSFIEKQNDKFNNNSNLNFTNNIKDFEEKEEEKRNSLESIENEEKVDEKNNVKEKVEETEEDDIKNKNREKNSEDSFN